MNVFGVGNAIVDTLAFVEEDFIREQDLHKGQMTLVDSSTQARLLHSLKDHELELRSGGSAANTMIALARCGGSGFYTGKVSRDPNGEFYRQDLLNAGIHFDVHPSDEEGLPTATCVVITTPDAERTMFTHLGVSTELSDHDISESQLKRCQYSYAEGYLWTADKTREAVLSAFHKSKAHNVKIAFSFSDAWLVNSVKQDFFFLTREFVDAVFCNAEEARSFADTKELDDAARLLGELAELVFITDGANGAIVVHNARIDRVPGLHVKAVDTNGAGDNFAGGVLYGLTHGYDPINSAKIGNYLAAKVVQIHGARIERLNPGEIGGILN